MIDVHYDLLSKNYDINISTDKWEEILLLPEIQNDNNILEALEIMVIYKALYGEKATWVRPLSMWSETVEAEGKTVKRFEYEW